MWKREGRNRVPVEEGGRNAKAFKVRLFISCRPLGNAEHGDDERYRNANNTTSYVQPQKEENQKLHSLALV